MQNHGFLASITASVSSHICNKIPLLMLISYRGSFGERDRGKRKAQRHRNRFCGRWVSLTLFLMLWRPSKKRIRQAQTLAESSLQPVALLTDA